MVKNRNGVWENNKEDAENEICNHLKHILTSKGCRGLSLIKELNSSTISQVDAQYLIPMENKGQEAVFQL